MLNNKEIILGSRNSLLARTQTMLVIEKLKKFGFKKLKTQFMKSSGDILRGNVFKEQGGKGLFTKEIDSLTVNGEIVNIPSYVVKVGDVVGIREKSKSLEIISNSLSSNNKKYDWLDWDSSAMSGRMLNVPSREMIPENIKEQLIVELYSK